MTNQQIILDAALSLMEAGKIGTTGRMLAMTNDKGETVTVPEPEPIHTFAAWKSIGYAVKRGEKAIAKVDIWKYAEGKKDEDEDDGEEAPGRMFRKTAYFFAPSQVERIHKGGEGMQNLVKLWRVHVNNWSWGHPRALYAQSRAEAEAIADRYPASDPVEYAGRWTPTNAAILLDGTRARLTDNW